MDENRHRYPVRLMAQYLEVSPSGFYRWKKHPSDRPERELKLLRAIEDIHHSSRKRYGSPKILHQLRALGWRVSKARVERLMRKHGVRSKTKRKFRVTTNSRHNHPISANVLARRFTATAANQVWAADVTYVWTHQGWLYLAVVLDLFSRQVVGWSMSDRLTKELCLSALTMALERRRPKPGLLHHSDRGCQYACREYRELLRTHEITSSMSRRGNCWDNAVVESFFRSLKTELVYHENFANHDEARSAIFDWIEVFYNRKRLHSSLGYLSPAQYENARLLA
jgi:transposase InsO family protein